MASNKKNKNYNKKIEQDMSRIQNQANKTILQANYVIDAAINDINKEIFELFYRYANQHNLTKEQAIDYLNTKLSTKDINRLKKKWSKSRDLDILAHIESNAYMSRLTRLEALKQNIIYNTNYIETNHLSLCDDLFKNVLQESYYKNIFLIQSRFNTYFSFAKLSKKMTNKILHSDFLNSNFYKRIKNNCGKFQDIVNVIMQKDLLAGKSTQQMAKDLSDSAKYSKNASIKLIRTETTHFYNSAQLEAYKELDIKKLLFMSTLDSRTSDICQQNDGKVILVKNAATGKNIPPMHPYCRSTTVAYINKSTLNNMQRRFKTDTENGVTDKYLTYKQWYKQYVSK